MSDQHPQSAPAAAPDPSRKPGPRSSPIVWGALILVFCVYASQRAFNTETIDAAWWVTATVIGIGAVLCIVGAVVLVRGRRGGDPADTAAAS